jgi:hypothetical protein
VIARITLLITAALAFVALAGIPTRYLVGDQAFLHCLAAVALCLVPALVTLAGTYAALRRDPRKGGLVALAASGVRMFAVLLVALLLNLQVPFFRPGGFLFWVLFAYLYLVAVEVVLLLAGRQTLGQGAPGNPPAPARD